MEILLQKIQGESVPSEVEINQELVKRASTAPSKDSINDIRDKGGEEHELS